MYNDFNENIVFRKIGHACFLATYLNQSIIFDPWFGAPLNYGTFHPFPKMIPPTKEEMESIIAIHISHIHDDHFQSEALSEFKKDIPIIIAKYSNPYFKNKIMDLGFTNIMELFGGEKGYRIGPFSLTSFPKTFEDGSFDSSLVLTVNESNYYIANDCVHYDGIYYIIKCMFEQFSGAFVGYTTINPGGWCIDMSECESFATRPSQKDIVNARQKFVWEHFRRVALTLEPEWISPYSSDYRFLNKDLKHHNALFSKVEEVYQLDIGSSNPILLQPGEKFDGKYINPFLRETFKSEIGSLAILPSWVQSNCPDYNFEETCENTKTYFLKVFKNEAANWRQEIAIEICVIGNNDEKMSLYYFFDGSTIEMSHERMPEKWADLVLEYPAAVLSELIKGRWSLRAFHLLFLFKAKWRRIKFDQMSIMSWRYR